jgi:hypothetical protein
MPTVERIVARKSAWRDAKNAVRAYARDPSDASAGAVAAAFQALKALAGGGGDNDWQIPEAPEVIPGLAEERDDPVLPDAA